MQLGEQNTGNSMDAEKSLAMCCPKIMQTFPKCSFGKKPTLETQEH